MPTLPSPTDVLTSTLLWLGVPFLVLLPISVALWLADWLRALGRVGDTARRLGENGHSFSRSAAAVPVVRLAWYVVLQGTLVALVYSSFRLGVAMSIPDATGRNIADGKSFTWSELWMSLTDYSAADQLPVQAFWLTVGWLVALNLAHVFKSKVLVGVVTVPVFPVVALSALAAIGIGIVGLMVLSLATWLQNPGYNLGMVALYAFWVIFLGGLGVVLPACVDEAEHVFGS